ncbi:MAG: hypothetical protein J2P26_02990 [Nocardiopsaceae bacterium]|nr:hypothetical protein [Nocardiopsaceae bacterium]
MASVSYSDLDSLAGELLPSRIVLSLIGISVDHNTYNTYQFPAQGDGNGHGSTVAFACNSNDAPQGNNGLLGLFQTPAENSIQCVPASVSGS